MHIIITIKSLLALLFSLSLATLTLSSSTKGLTKRLLFTGNIRNVKPHLRAEVVEGVYANTEPYLLESLSNTSRIDIPDINYDVGSQLPVLNTTVTFILPAQLEMNLTPNLRRLYRDDPMGFRMRARRKAERNDRAEDLFDFLSGSELTSATTSSTMTSISLPNQDRIDRIVSNIESRLSKIATTTGEGRAYATMVVKSLVSEALVSNLPVETISSANAEETISYTYETKETSYAATVGVKAFVTSYRVLVKVVETSVPSTSLTTAMATTSGPQQGVIGATSTSTAGVGKVEMKAVAALGLLGFVVEAVL